jgi:hypothetical protein
MRMSSRTRKQLRQFLQKDIMQLSSMSWRTQACIGLWTAKEDRTYQSNDAGFSLAIALRRSCLSSYVRS